jgi:N-acetylneuraminate synthase
MNQSIKIADQTIGRDHEPFVIAEMSGNHNRSLERALKIVDAVAESGAQALKLQTYTPDTITLDVRENEFNITDPNSLWAGKNLYELYRQAYTPWEWHEPIIRRAKGRGLSCFSSPFDETAVDFLERLDVPAYKIASFENNHLPLIRKVAQTGKPIILSTGMATVAELDEAVTTARTAGCKDLILLKCTSSYPATPENSNLLTIGHLRELFNCEVGLSDHTLGLGAAVAAVALGASVIEKHFTLSRAEGGVDSAFSMEPAEMAQLVLETKRAWQSLGTVKYGPTEAEKKSLVFRRSLYIAEDMNAGDILTPMNLRIVRPGNGLHPRHYEQLLGKTVKQNVKRGTAVRWEFLG